MDTSNVQQVPQQQTSNKSVVNKFTLAQFLSFGFVMLVIGFVIGYVLFNDRLIDKKQTAQYSLPSHTTVSLTIVPTFTTPPNSSNANVNLKTFKNDKFTFNYPANYKYQFFGSVLYVGNTQGIVPLGPNGSCDPGGIQINNRWSYNLELMQSNFLNLQINNIPNGMLYIGVQRPGACGGITHHIAQIQDKSNMVEISLDGDDSQDMTAFNTIISTFSFEKKQ